MKILTATQHGYCDYLIVSLFLFAPIIGITGFPALLGYSLAAVHLTLTLCTDFPLGAFKRLHFTVHGWIERMVGPILLVLPFVFGFDSVARGFYIFTGLIVLLLGALTDYRKTPMR